jgi:hypothetical protein
MARTSNSLFQSEERFAELISIGSAAGVRFARQLSPHQEPFSSRLADECCLVSEMKGRFIKGLPTAASPAAQPRGILPAREAVIPVFGQNADTTAGRIEPARK